ncbi:hypothetical protein MO867_07825 [Microbulbifer sp. OS29]|uniref:Zn-dependent protease with chaperone function n=1 Tax=Microbulbifer okhotskensis TaxID=2926617 RepID=A0A9X2EN81_9GAMM|nr:hypothetical protein [Microbulbifer okhotskensis]MCO1334250.1 hypothetical protein [Microbulbifer okhotskensis]
MAGQDLYQVVSTGRTLHAKKSDAVIRDAAKLFSMPEAQARRLLLKGWVLKDQLSSEKALAYRSGLQKIGLRVEVCPAGRFDNRELIAKIKVAQRRKAQASTASSARDDSTLQDPPARSCEDSIESEKVADSSAAGNADQALDKQQSPLSLAEQCLSGANVLPGAGAAIHGKAVWGLIKASLVPCLFLSILAACVFSAGHALWQIPWAVWQGELTGVGVVFSLLVVSLALFVSLLLVWPFFHFPVHQRDQVEPRELLPSEGKGVRQLMDVWVDRLGLPKISQVFITADIGVLSQPQFSQVLRQQLPVSLGLASIASLEGKDVLALIARSLSFYQGRLLGAVSWLSYGVMQQLELMQWALENERSAVCPDNNPGGLQRPLHNALVICGHFLLPLIQRLEALHRRLSSGNAALLQERADTIAAQIVGRDTFADFTKTWHRLIHADLLVAEINREARALGQCCENTPAAVHWTLENLDEDACTALEVAMAQAGDPWDRQQAPDSDRIADLTGRAFASQIQGEIKLQPLFADFATLAYSETLRAAGTGCQMVENRSLLSSSHEAEASAGVLEAYFNRLPPLALMPLKRPAMEEMRALDLQRTIDWLRSKLVDLRDLRERKEGVQIQIFAMQQGAALIRAKVRMNPQDYCLKGGGLATAQESIALKRAALEEVQKQLQQIYSVFYQRVCLALVAMPANQRQSARNQLRHLAAYDSLGPHLDRLAGYSHMLAMFTQYLSPDLSERELIQKYMALSVRELEAAFAVAADSPLLKEQGLARVLELKAKPGSFQQLPQGRQEILTALQSMESRCKHIRSLILEHYQIQLSTLLQQCLIKEQQLQLNPLRLLKAG